MLPVAICVWDKLPTWPWYHAFTMLSGEQAAAAPLCSCPWAVAGSACPLPSSKHPWTWWQGTLAHSTPLNCRTCSSLTSLSNFKVQVEIMGIKQRQSFKSISIWKLKIKRDRKKKAWSKQPWHKGWVENQGSFCSVCFSCLKNWSCISAAVPR